MNKLLILNIIFLLIILKLNLFAQFNIKLENITEYKMDDKKLIYKITAKEKNIKNLKSSKSLIFFNKEKLVSENIFYSNGTFDIKDVNIKFEKAYFLEGKFIMINVKGNYIKTEFISQKVVYEREKLQLKNSLIIDEKSKKKKIDYILNII